MKPTLKFSSAILPFFIASGAMAVDYATTGGDAGVAATWTPAATPIIAGGNITPAAGDRLILNGGNLTGAGSIIINAGAGFIQSAVATGQHQTANHIDLAGTGTDGLGAFQNLGNDWANVSDARLTANATIRVESGGWRHDDHGTGRNVFNLNGNTLSVIGANSWWFVNTTIQGPGTINVDIRGEFNFEASSILPANVTMNLVNTRSSSWDGANRVMLGNINMTNSILETRQNDANKAFNGTINITGTGTFRTDTQNGSTGNSQQINGQVTGTGRLVRDGIDPTAVVFLNNGTNNYAGGTDIVSGTLQLGAAGAIPANSNINVFGGASSPVTPTLNLGAFNQQMGSGTIMGNVTGTGILQLTTAGVKTINAGSAITNAGGVQLTGGTLRALGTNALAGITGPLAVTANATLQPTNQGLNGFRRTGPDVFADQGTTGAIATGPQDGIAAIDSAAKPFGDNNSFIYTGQLVNTTGANIDVSFGEQYDDQVRVKVDGNTVLLDGGWNTATASSLVSLTPGTHSIEISSFDGSGGAGPNSGWDKGVGIKIGPHTIADLNGGGDNAAFSRITSTTLPAGLALSLGNITDTKSIAVNAGVALTIDTSLMIGGASYTLSGDISGGGNIIKGGAGTLILSGVTTTTGTATVNAGSLVLNGTHAFSSITIANGATVSGSGSATAAAMTIAAGGHVAPGNSVGTMTVGTITIAGSLDAEASANGVNDLLITTNTIWSAGASVNLTLLGGFTPGPGNSFDLVNGTITGTTPTFNLPSLAPGLTWNTSQFMNTGVLSVVPEPSSILLSLASIGFLLRRRRR